MTTTTPRPTHAERTSTGQVVGGATGALALCALAVLLVRRVHRGKRQSRGKVDALDDGAPDAHDPLLQPTLPGSASTHGRSMSSGVGSTCWEACDRSVSRSPNSVDLECGQRCGAGTETEDASRPLDLARLGSPAGSVPLPSHFGTGSFPSFFSKDCGKLEGWVKKKSRRSFFRDKWYPRYFTFDTNTCLLCYFKSADAAARKTRTRANSRREFTLMGLDACEAKQDVKSKYPHRFNLLLVAGRGTHSKGHDTVLELSAVNAEVRRRWI